MKLFSNETVFRGHPDKVCDQISDAILDECLRQDKNSRCGIETVGGKGIIFITGEVTTKATIDVEKTAKRVLEDIGYSTNYEIINNLGTQSPDIELGTNDNTGGAGDNGMMFGFACNETKELLPKAMVILQSISKEYDKLTRIDNRFLPDGKAQITGYYDEDNNLTKIKTLAICYQNTEEEREATDKIITNLCNKICEKYNVQVERYLINPTGKFKVGGFEGDAGLTGRKIVVDTYQSFANVGGGAFSGKDPTKVDKSGAYKAREIAKDYLIKSNLQWCEVQLAYAIGISEPLSIYINSDQGQIEPNQELYEQCTPKNIINDLDLKNVIYEEKAKFGHFTE